ncbi:ATP-binding protein [Microbacterium gubbeenense]|uniref:ATP-binding protein n=1 Tax=Microbacterium gubbeenense TaxID=159896 RepID=UPI003F98FC77
MTELLERFSMTFAKEAIDTFPALAIQGARQVGKSTFARQLADSRDARFVTLDDEVSRAAAEDDPAAFVDQNSTGTLVIDELQRAPRLILAIKASIDRDRRPGRYLLTGSSDLLLLPGAPDSLAGRAVTIELRSLSQGEIRGERDDFVARANAGIDAAQVETAWDRPTYAAAIARGGYPEVRSLGERMRNVWFDSYVERLLRRDIADLAPRVDPSRISSVLRIVAAANAGELVKTRIARDANLPETSVTSYLELLEILYLTTRLRPWTPNLTTREVGRAKVVVGDAGLALRLARVSEGQLVPIGNAHIGAAIEGFVVGELMRQRAWSDAEFELFHYRDRDGLEVDVVIELGDGSIIGIEVKAGSTAKAEHFKGLRSLRDRLGDRFVGGYVLNTAQKGAFFGDRLATLPVASLWEL